MQPTPNSHESGLSNNPLPTLVPNSSALPAVSLTLIFVSTFVPVSMILTNLPPELQSKICSYLVKSIGPSSIHALLRTCKQLYDVALPFSVQIFRNTAPIHIGRGPCSETRNVQFLRYILISKPELASRVDTIILGGFTTTRERVKTPTAVTSTEEEPAIYQEFIINALGPQLSEADLTRRDSWIAHLKEGFTDAQISLILLVCSGVRRLYFEDYQEGMSQNQLFKKPDCFIFLLEMAKTLSTSNTSGFNAPLRNLRHVQSQSHEDNDCGWEQAFRLMALPQLKSYESLDTTRRGNFAGESTILPLITTPRSSSVRSISLHQSLAPAAEVQALLRVCKHLEKFEYISPTFEPISGIFARDIMEAVLPHARTLHHLHINFSDECKKIGWEDDPQRLYLGTELAQMTALRHLSIGMQSLTGKFDQAPTDEQDTPSQIEGAPQLIECLPESLVELFIRDCGKGILDQAKELMATIEKGERFNNLTRIVLVFKAEIVNLRDIRQAIPERTKKGSRCDLWVAFQHREARWVSSGRGHTFEGIRAIPSLCSRIFADDLRNDWMNFRGGLAHKLHPKAFGPCSLARGVDERMIRLLLLKPPHEN
ncbi:unnamed protein product [Clonostachys byssicola]|uniref:F-box domain-containing protein n=1 Tax=Clonostachys byssicola TaxID=160290 RepID=A0A9N9UK18_9HYPO|nr:unnamed protein product [Clonostachys byssicola]